MENPKPESIQPLSIARFCWMSTIYLQMSLLPKGKEMLLAVAYIKTTPVGEIWEVPQEVN